jgi:tetratricopeptide (TPR) repeat protein
MVSSQPDTVEQAWKEYFQDSVKYYRQGYYRHAESSGQTAQMYARRFDPNDPRRAETLIESARAEWKLGQYSSALGRLDEAEKILTKKPAKQPLLEARSWNMRAEILSVLGLNEEAASLATKAYQARLKMHGADHLETVESLDTKLFLEFGDAHQSITIREKLLGKGHPETAPSYLLLARSRPYYESAEKHIRQAMRLLQKINPEHADLAEAWTLLGHHERLQGNIEEAEQTLQHALKHWRRLDARHPRGHGAGRVGHDSGTAKQNHRGGKTLSGGSRAAFLGPG